MPKSAPSWVVFQFDTQDDVAESSFVLAMKRSLVLEPGQSVAIDFGIDPTTLATGSTRSTVSYGMVIEGEYPGCLTDLDSKSSICCILLYHSAFLIFFPSLHLPYSQSHLTC